MIRNILLTAALFALAGCWPTAQAPVATSPKMASKVITLAESKEMRFNEYNLTGDPVLVSAKVAKISVSSSGALVFLEDDGYRVAMAQMKDTPENKQALMAIKSEGTPILMQCEFSDHIIDFDNCEVR